MKPQGVILFTHRNQGGDCHGSQSGGIVAMKEHDRGVFTINVFQCLNSMLNEGLSGQITWEHDVGMTWRKTDR